MNSPFEARTMSTASLPVIDISGLSSSKHEDRKAVGAQIRAACIEYGFFYVSGHGVPQGLMDAALEQTRAFFAQPDEQKAKVARTKSFCNRGWDPLKAESLGLDVPDNKETLFLGLDLPLDHPAVVARRFNHGPNQWPEGLPGFKTTMRAYHAALRDVSERMMVGLALALDLPEDYFEDFNDTPLSTMRLLHYPPQPVNAGREQVGAGAHTDFGALTFLLQDENGGLQVQGLDGEWISAPPIPGTYVFNIGDAIARWTNDLFRSTLHRVINVSGKERYSVPFFYSGNPDHVLECLPGCLKAGESPRYPAVTVEKHMQECYRRAREAASSYVG
ncbi:isopenicillin N synthase family dioxygenase [Caldimonas thermodepolymerans]|uniref:2-oxoglutarate-dependent ethylene/succinate-forming enzyme n=2 Tax=Caldimonas thermodepolymerans TaxID=215580 RepID=A0AA46DBG0_9BURK|nr:2-oxoglutarate and iron-dependent oxygenase domain-containing protein [Caldimonas thermodepolymerans]TCP02427.1 isopenicillin N synthase-like dioxygenase [Caldimonas thermodepolymerans]